MAMALKYPAASAALPCSPNHPPPLLCSRRSLPFRIPSASQQPGDHLPRHHHLHRRRHHLHLHRRRRHHHHHQHQATMDLFPDGSFVRLESRVRRMYLHADGDWSGVILRPNGAVPALNAVWRVEHWFSEAQGITYVLLQNAAYGRYLSFTVGAPALGHQGRRTTQTDRSEPNVLHNLNVYPWMWVVARLEPPDQDYVSLRYANCYLRANGRHNTSYIYVTADVDTAARITTMMHWTVHQVAASPVPRPLPIVHQPHQGGRRMGVLFWRRTGILGPGVFPHPPRTIRHVQASDEGEFDQNHHNWPSFAFYDSSVIELKNELRLLQNWNDDMAAYTLCMLPGSHGRLMPLATDDLPGSLDSMNIVVFRTGSQAAAGLRYPAPEAVAPNDAEA